MQIFYPVFVKEYLLIQVRPNKRDYVRGCNMKTNTGVTVTKTKQLGDRIFEKNNIYAYIGSQGRILYVLWQSEGIPILEVSDKCGLPLSSLTTMLEHMKKAELIRREQYDEERWKPKLYLTEKGRNLQNDYDAFSNEMTDIYYHAFSSEEIGQFESYLFRVRENLERWSGKLAFA